MPREFTFNGKRISDLKGMSTDDFAKLCTSKMRRALKRGFTEQEKKLIANVKQDPSRFHKTHVREMIVIPEFLGVKFGVYNGKEFVTLEVKPEHLGKRLGEFSQSRRMVKHSAPGFGATKSSKYVPLK